MSRPRLNEGVLPCFIRYMIEKPHSFCCRRLNRISMLNAKYCGVARSMSNFDTLFFANNNSGVTVGTRNERIYIENFNLLTLHLLALHRLLKDVQDLHIVIDVIANMPDEDELEFFTPEAARAAGEMLRDFFPNAIFSVGFEAEGNPPIARKILPTLEVVRSRIQQIQCSLRHIAWFEGFRLDKLEIIKKRSCEGINRTNLPMILKIGARQLMSHENIDFSVFLDTNIPIQPHLQQLTCFADLCKNPVPSYDNIFKTLNARLPNLQKLDLTHRKCENGQMLKTNCTKAIFHFSGNIRKIIESAHVRTKMSVRLQAQGEDHFSTAREMFNDLLLDLYISRKNENPAEAFGKQRERLTVQGRNSEAVIVIEQI